MRGNILQILICHTLKGISSYVIKILLWIGHAVHRTGSRESPGSDLRGGGGFLFPTVFKALAVKSHSSAFLCFSLGYKLLQSNAILGKVSFNIFRVLTITTSCRPTFARPADLRICLVSPSKPRRGGCHTLNGPHSPSRLRFFPRAPLPLCWLPRRSTLLARPPAQACLPPFPFLFQPNRHLPRPGGCRPLVRGLTR